MLILKWIEGLGTSYSRGKKNNCQSSRYVIPTDGSAIVEENDAVTIINGEPEEYYELKTETIIKTRK